MIITPMLRLLPFCVLLFWQGSPWAAEPPSALGSFKRPDAIPFPAGNPYSLEKAALGKMLFFDSRVSGTENMNCASCRNPSFGWESSVPLAIGALNQPVARHAPTVLNQAWGHEFFWDGRASSLEEQPSGPIMAAGEMNMDLATLIARIRAVPDYEELFKRAFPDSGLTADNLMRAIATYERTWSPTAPPR